MDDIYEWYIDVFFIINFLMDTAGLLAAGIVCNQKIRIGRLLLVSAGATASSILLLLCLPAYFLYLLLVHIVVNPLMVVFCYRPRSWWNFLRPLLVMYLVLFAAGGVQQSLRLYGFDSAGQILLSGLLAIGMFLIWQIRWRVTQRVCLVELEFQGERISLTAFCDSGNLLRDPKSGREVSVLQRSALPESWCMSERADFVLEDVPEKNRKSWDRVEQQLRKNERKNYIEQKNEKVSSNRHICCANAPEDTGLHSHMLHIGRLRRIPYRTVGGEDGKIEILTLDKMRIYQKGRVREVEKPIVGLFDGILMEHPRVELLLNGAYV